MDVTKDSIKTIASYPISQKQQLKLVEVAGEKILLGVSGDNISYLKTLEDTNSNSNKVTKIVSNEPIKLQEPLEKNFHLQREV